VAQDVARPVGHAGALVGGLAAQDRLVPGLAAAGIDHERKAGAGGEPRPVGDAEHLGRVRAPGEGVARQIPVVDDLADRGQHLARIERAVARIEGCLGHRCRRFRARRA